MARNALIPPSTRFTPLPCPPVLSVPACRNESDQAPQWLTEGTVVQSGDALTGGTGEIPAAVAPMSGIVGRPVTVRRTDGKRQQAVELLVPNPGTVLSPPPLTGSTIAEFVGRLHSIGQENLAEWVTRLGQLGVWADRWTSPNLSGQLLATLRRPVDTIVCNLLDSDPWLGVSRGVASVWPNELIAGLSLLGRLTSAKHIWALVDQADLSPTMAPLRESAAAISKDVRIAPIENDYPQPNPTLLVFAATHRRLRPGSLPTEQGVLLLDAAAAASVGLAAIHGSPMQSVPTVIYDQPGNAIHALTVPIGSTVRAVMEHLQLPMVGRHIFAGSPLRQLRVRPTDIICDGDITLFVAPEQATQPASPCIGCGWCVEGCPTQCRPAALLEAAQREDLAMAHANGLLACIECGLCTYVCPSQLPLLEGIRGLIRMEHTHR